MKACRYIKHTISNVMMRCWRDESLRINGRDTVILDGYEAMISIHAAKDNAFTDIDIGDPPYYFKIEESSNGR